MSGGGRYRYLFSPLRLGPVVVRNRIVFSAHLTNYAEHGRPSRQHAAYYAARAAGGAGLIITEEHSTHPTDWPYEKMIHGFHPDVVEGYRRITEAVHRHDTPIFAQLNHNGGQASSMYTRQAVWAPSPVPDPLFREVPKAVSDAEIADIVAGYATVAARCRAGGFDGVELQCSHSSIVRGFLSRATNQRRDRWGGTLENRARLLHTIVDAVREAIGPGLVLGVRLCGDELIENGIVLDEAVAVARQLEAGGRVDYLNTSIGVATATLFMIEASMHVPPGYALFIPSALRGAVELPVVGVGRFKDPLQAERALAEGHCDLVGVVRGQIADPEFAAKARGGAAADIRLCLSCNQECVGRMGLNRWLGCIENPWTGREALGPARLVMRRRPKRLLVVGAGPGGLQTAVSAAEAGHRVTVWEQGDEPGGQVRLAATVPNRAELGDLVRNLVGECRRLGIDIQLGRRATVASVLAEGPDAVVVATGSRPARPWWAPPDDERIVDVVDVVRGDAQPTGDVVVIDEVGFHQATSVAELLADRGCAVEILTPAMLVGQDLGITLDLETWWYRAEAKGIVQTTDSVVVGLDSGPADGAEMDGDVVDDAGMDGGGADGGGRDDGERVNGERDNGERHGGALMVLHHPTGVTRSRAFDWCVLAVPAAAEDELYHALVGRIPEVIRVGDCVAPRRAHAAVVEGRRAGAAL